MYSLLQRTPVHNFQWFPREAIDVCSKHTEKKNEDVFQRYHAKKEPLPLLVDTWKEGRK